MKKEIKILFLIFLAGRVAHGSQSTLPYLLRDGFILTGIEGNIKYSDSRDSWFFEFESDIKDDKGIVKAGTSLELLPSSTLEKMAADANKRSASRYRISGRITRYKGSNYIYVNYFQFIIAQKPETGNQKSEEEVDANDPLAIPAEIMEKFRATSTTTAYSAADSNTASAPELSSIPADFILINRTAFLVEQGAGEFALALDYLGQNLSNVSYRLLPCDLLEQSENKQSSVYEQLRFNITGIVTRYKGDDYLLLIKAMRYYGHGNFGG